MSKFGILTLYIQEAFIDLDEIFLDREPKPTQEEYCKYQKISRYIQMCLRLIDDDKEDFDWKYLANNGLLCQRDFNPEYFAESLKKAGIGSYKEYNKAYSERVK